MAEVTLVAADRRLQMASVVAMSRATVAVEVAVVEDVVPTSMWMISQLSPHWVRARSTE